MLHVIIAEASGNVDLSSSERVRLPGVEFVANAAEGAVAQTSLLINDEGGTVTVTGLRRAWAYEDTAPAGEQIIWTGYVGDREYGRIAGGDDEFVIGADRRISAALVESNQLLSRRLITGADGERPAETDLQRIAWLLSSNYVSGVAATYVASGSGYGMDKADLRGQSAYDVLSDCANRSNRNFHLVLVETSATSYSHALVYDYDYAAILTSTIRLTNVDADVDDSTTFAVDPDAILRRTPERVYSGMFTRFTNGANYQQDPATGDAFGYRDAARDAINVSDPATAAAIGARYLADADSEEDRITCRFVVPAAKVNALREGYRVQAKFSHFTDYSSDYSYMRCVRRTVRQLSDDYYSIQVELVPGEGGGAGVETDARLSGMGNGGSSNQFNYQGGGLYNPVYHYNDGDNPFLGAAPAPKTGLIEYIGPLPGRTGLRVLGSGTVTVELAFSVSLITDGGVTFTAKVYNNGVEQATWQKSFADLGLTSYVWQPIHETALETSFSVASGDEITWSIHNNGNDVVTAFPTGIGNTDHWFRVSGNLVA